MYSMVSDIFPSPDSETDGLEESVTNAIELADVEAVGVAEVAAGTTSPLKP